MSHVVFARTELSSVILFQGQFFISNRKIKEQRNWKFFCSYSALEKKAKVSRESESPFHQSEENSYLDCVIG